MRRSITIAACMLSAAMLPLAVRADAPQDSGTAYRTRSAAELVIDPVNRGLFAQCAAGRDAAALLAQRRDDASLAQADAAFARCTRTAVYLDGVAAGELGIAATAYLAAETRTGEARRAALGRAADYAQRADEDWRSYHRVGIPTGAGEFPKIETRPGTDSSDRVEVGLPGGPSSSAGSYAGAVLPGPRPPAATRPTAFDVLALGIADQARAERSKIVVTK